MTPSAEQGPRKMKQFEFLEWHDEGTTATLWLNRPPVNAVISEMYLEIRKLFSDLADYLPEARAVVLAGRGKHFCAGNDLSEFQSMNPENAPARMKQVREAFWADRKSVV